MKTLSAIIRVIKRRKGEYKIIAAEIGISYFGLYNLVSGRTKSPKMEVWLKLQKWMNNNHGN